jgi:hypothetical protein
LANGRWPFAGEFQAVYKTAANKMVGHDATRNLIISGLKNSDANIPGLAFFSSGADDSRNGSDKIAKVRRAGGNNCAPLVLN